LIEIRAENLQFSLEEAAILFNEKMGLNLTYEQVMALTDRTESWIVGLQLAAKSLKRHPVYAYDTFIEEFTGSHQFVLDYLTEEALGTLPAAQRQFLLRTSALVKVYRPHSAPRQRWPVEWNQRAAPIATGGGRTAGHSSETLPPYQLVSLPEQPASHWP
jgi:hypothetical protein